MSRSIAVALALLSTVAGCAESAETDAAGTLETSAGTYSLQWAVSPDPAVAGDITVLSLDIAHDGDPVEGATLEVVPWMPDHDHGAEEDAVISELGGGSYAADLLLTMSGYWEVELTVDADAGMDTATIGFDVE